MVLIGVTTVIQVGYLVEQVNLVDAEGTGYMTGYLKSLRDEKAMMVMTAVAWQTIEIV